MTVDRQRLCLTVLYTVTVTGALLVYFCVSDLHFILRGQVCNPADGTQRIGLVDITFVTTDVFD
jgi:hypothetical protein